MNKLLWATVIVFFISSCNATSQNENETTAQIPTPEVTDDGWEVASLASVGMDPAKFIQLLNRLDQIGEHRVHSIIVVKDKKLVFEKYGQGPKFNLGQYTGETGYDMNDLHVLCSATKSITSALLGIAIDKGFIESVEQNVFDFFPEYADLLIQDPAKSKITLKHLLTMTSGLTYDDESLPYTDPNNDMNRFFSSSDPIKYLLAKPLFAEPGTVFNYANCNTNIIGQIIGRAANKRLDVFAKDYLFSKLGIELQQWQMVRNDIVLCSGDLHLRPRDMAKFGLLFLNKGEWKGEQIISPEWCAISTTAYLNPNSYNSDFGWANGYGYQWWQRTYSWNFKKFASYFASGWGGQTIIVIPDLNLVIVTTAGNWYEPENISPYTIVSDYIIPSVEEI